MCVVRAKLSGGGSDLEEEVGVTPPEPPDSVDGVPSKDYSLFVC